MPLPPPCARRSGEAQAAFGDGAVYVEKYIASPRHVEIQILADGEGHAIHLGERDCSIQRRHQKLIEEAPSPAVSPELRAPHGRGRRRGRPSPPATRAPARSSSCSTPSGDFYFMEMNTRVQVEHCVTEMVTGIDIVKTGIRIAAGEGLPLRQDDVADQRPRDRVSHQRRGPGPTTSCRPPAP